MSTFNKTILCSVWMMTTITGSVQSWLKHCSAAVLVVKPVLPPFHFSPPFLLPLPQSEMMRKQLTFCSVKEMLTRFRNLQLHVLIYFHLDWYFPPSCLSPSSRRKNLYRVYVGRANNQSFPVTHKYTKHTCTHCGHRVDVPCIQTPLIFWHKLA